jgi:hypothetical protein
LVFTLRFFQSAAMQTHELTAKLIAKMPKITCNWSSWVSDGLAAVDATALEARPGSAGYDYAAKAWNHRRRKS